MPSPFPGMDPYIESRGLWGDFHGRLINRIADSLGDAAPEHYLVRTQERSYLVLVQSEGKESHSFLPDVSVSSSRGRRKPTKKGATAVAELPEGSSPVAMRAFIAEEHREAFVEIYEAEPEQRLVTTVEVLSPSNKTPNTPGWTEYQRKRQSVLLGGVNLVEIDLLRGGQRMPMLDPWPESPYRLLLARAEKLGRCQVWPAHFRWALPSMPVPLAMPDADLQLSLQPMVEEIYKRSRYERSIDYSKRLTPRLNAEDAAWLEQRLRHRSGTR